LTYQTGLAPSRWRLSAVRATQQGGQVHWIQAPQHVPTIQRTYAAIRRSYAAILSIRRTRGLLEQERIYCQVPLMCHFQRFDDGFDWFLLADETLSALGDGIRYQGGVDGGGQNDHLGVGAHLMDPGDDVEPIGTREIHVEQARIGLMLSGSRDRLVRIQGCCHHREPVLRQGDAQRVEQQSVVVTDQQPHDATAS
jgi:hypothetical protein